MTFCYFLILSQIFSATLFDEYALILSVPTFQISYFLAREIAVYKSIDHPHFCQWHPLGASA